MTPFQRAKLENSVKLLKILLGLLLEMKDVCKKHKKEHKTIMVEELFTNILSDDEPLWVIRRKHENGKELYEAKPMLTLIREMICDVEAELRILGGKDDAA